MISTVERKLRERRRRIAVPPLGYLLQWVAAHAISPYMRSPATCDLIAIIERDIGRRLREIANVGGFRFFGIANSAEFGSPPISLMFVQDHRFPNGAVTVHAAPLVEWILRGGAGRDGWLAPDALSVESLN